jgi:hypothetical protein
MSASPSSVFSFNPALAPTPTSNTTSGSIATPVSSPVSAPVSNPAYTPSPAQAPASLYPHPQNTNPVPAPAADSSPSPISNSASFTPPVSSLNNDPLAYHPDMAGAKNGGGVGAGMGGLGVNSVNTMSAMANMNNKMTPPKSKGGGLKSFLILLLILIIILAGGAAAYAYVKKIGPFAFTSYTESNFSSSLLTKIASMSSASYIFSGAINVVPRDAGAVPFDLKVSNEKELKEAYYYDKQKLESASLIISSLNSAANYSSYKYQSYSTKPKIKPYVNNLSEITFPPAVDPESVKTFEYQTTDNGNNFNLTVTFVTDDAVKSAKGYDRLATSTKVEGKKVTFTKDSRFSFYLSEEPPKPMLVAMSDSMANLPPEMNAKIAVGVSSDFQPGQLANWQFNLDAQGDFGDMSFKVNADAIKKDTNYYFKINNVPSFFLFNQLAAMKGKWIMVPIKTASTTSTSTSSTSEMGMNDNYSPLSSVQSSISSSEEKYKENRDKAIKLVKKVVAIADEEQIFVFKTPPTSEKVGERNLVKYVLGLRKDKVLTFYTKIQSEINSNPEFADYKDAFIDQGYINYLKSDEFSQTFDYMDKNNTLTLWVDKDGFPAIVENIMRVVPPDSAVGLKGKQINVTFKLDISNINQTINIQAPAGAVSFDKITAEMNGTDAGGGASGIASSSGGVGPIDEARLKGMQAAMKSSLSNMRAEAELFYSQNSNSFGNKPFALSACSNMAGTLFGNEKMFSLLNYATKNNPSTATCVSSGSSGAVTSWALSAPIPGDDGFSWCVDSTGASKRIIDKLKGKSCAS